MSVVIPPDFGLIRYRWQVAGDPEPMVVTLGFSPVSGSITASQCAQLAFDGMIATAFVPAQAQNVYTMLPTEVSLNRGGIVDTGVAGVNTPGTLAGITGAPPNNCAVLVRKNTNRGGRKGRGRMYVPPYGLLEGNVDPAGFIQSADVTALQTRWNNLRTNLSTAGLLSALLHSQLTDAPDGITSFTVDGRIATQRRRLRR